MDQAYETILDAICTGALKAGTKFTQEEIAARLHVSRQPVVNALAVLRAQGFVVETNGRGLIVAPVDPALFDAIYQLRSAIEPMAVTLAAPRLNAESIARGRTILEKNKAIPKDSQASLNGDIEFHSFIYEMSGNPLIIETMRLYWQHLRRAMGEVLRHPGWGDLVADEHEKIFEEMVHGRAKVASRMMRNHLTNAHNRIAPTLGR